MDREVFVMGQGWVSMRDLRVGDRISCGNPGRPRAFSLVTEIVSV